jgi:hypothetical protein
MVTHLQQIQPSPFTELKDNMATTYEKIATTTLGSAAASIAFNSLPSTFTDLRLVLVATATTASDVNIIFNASSIYCSQTRLIGTGTAATSGRVTTAFSRARIDLNNDVLDSIPQMYTIDMFSYAGGTNKTCLITQQQDANGSGSVGVRVGLFPSTAAITSFTLNASNFATGTIATIYGIKAA